MHHRISKDPTTKSFSQAIRLEGAFRPQCTGSYFHDGKSCALGGAAEATGYTPSDFGKDDGAVPRHLMARFPHIDAGLFFRISNCNDAGWTREQIADWVESMRL